MDDSQKSKEQLLEELKKLRVSEERFRLLVKNVRGSLAVFDYDGKLLFINDIGADMVGKKPEDIVGLTQWDIFPKEVADVQIENIRRVIDTGDIYYEKAKTFINNQWRHYDVSVQPYLDYEGNTIAALIVAYDATKRVDAEKGVREKEENYRILFESSPDSILIVDFEGTIIDCNRASESISGEPPEQAIGKTIFDFGGLPEEETERLLQFLEKARHGEIIRPITIKFWISGELHWLNIYPTLLERDGVAVAIQAIIRDITERKKTEIALKDSEQRYRDLVEKADIAILVDNADGGLTYFNNKLCQLFGYTHEEMIKQTIKTLVHPEDYDLVKSYHDRRFSGEESPGRYEFRGIRKDGSTIYLEIDVSSLNKGGETIGTRSFIRDITARRLAEDAVRQSEQFSRAVIENSPLAISVRSRTGQLLSFNSGWKRLWGHSTEDIKKQLYKVRKEFKFDDRDDYLGPWKEKVREIYENGGHLFIPEVRFEKHPSGKPLWLSQYFYALKNETGEVDRVVIMTEDITERNAAQAALRESEENYRTLVEQANDGIVVVQNNLIKFVNSYLAKLLGYTVEAMVDSEYTNYVHPDELIRVAENYRRRMNKEPVPSFYDTALIRKDGLRLEVEFSAGLTRYKGKPADLVFIRDISDRKEAEAALRESEKKFRELTDLLPQTVFEMDTEARLTFTNKQGLETFGYSDADVAAGLDITRLFLPEDLERLKGNIAKRLAGSDFEDHEYDMVRKDGSTFPALIYSTPIIKKGKSVGLRGIVIDITERRKYEREIQKHRDHLEELVDERSSELIVANEQLRREIIERKRTEEQARESGERYRILFETSGEGILIADYKTRKFKYANPAICRLLGYSEEEFVGMGIDDIHPRENLEEIHAEFERNSTMPDYVAENLPCLRKDGTIVYADIVGAVQYIDGVKHTVGFFRDATERVRTQNALRESEERFRLLAEISPDAIGIIQDGRMKFMNKAAMKMFGVRNLEEIYDRSVFDFIHSDFRDVAAEHMQKALEGEHPTDFAEERLLRHDNRLGYVESAYAPFIYEGRPAIQIVARDITERKRMEEALRESELQYRTTIDSMGDSIHVINRDFKIVLCNKALLDWHKKIGLNQNIIGRNVFEFYPFLPDKVRQEYEYVFETGETHVVVDKNEIGGRTYITETRKIPISDGDKVVRAVTVLRDITERMQAEEALKESEAWMRSTIESLPFDFFAINKEGYYIIQNSVCKDHWGELIGKKPEEINVSEEIRNIWANNNRKALSGETVSGEVCYEVNGKLGYFYNVVAPIRFQGSIRGLMGVNMDITDLRRTENELRKATEELNSEREALEAKNIALREVLSQIEDEKKALKLQIAANIDRVILPAIQRLRENCGDRLKKHVDNLESSLKTISAPFIEQLRNNYSQLTPRELEICRMIKNGMMSKEISEILNVSILTVHKHREMIRKKLGIKNKNVNLSSFLQSL